jgi:hypothetical protein
MGSLLDDGDELREGDPVRNRMPQSRFDDQGPFSGGIKQSRFCKETQLFTRNIILPIGDSVEQLSEHGLRLGVFRNVRRETVGWCLVHEESSSNTNAESQNNIFDCSAGIVRIRIL